MKFCEHFDDRILLSDEEVGDKDGDDDGGEGQEDLGIAGMQSTRY